MKNSNQQIVSERHTPCEDYMQLAIDMARKAAVRGEVPIGAVIVQRAVSDVSAKDTEKNVREKVIAKAFNTRERSQSALAHAEMLAIQKACKRLHSWRLDNCTMYVTLEPCPMCAGAILNARISNVVIGAKASGIAADSVTGSLEIYRKNNLNWTAEVAYDLREECSVLLKNFFASKRKTKM
jgi:tRNA(adenine34) deaminase